MRAADPHVKADATIDIVVKLGGGLLAHTEHFGDVLVAIGSAASRCRLLVVPGGGPFADAVREADRHVGLSDDAAHSMAVLAMDQYAHLLASRVVGGRVVESLSDIGAAVAASRVPVLAPSRWLREADPLPHTWDVTSDSIAAWVSGELGAHRLVLVKPPHAAGPMLVDRYFARVLPAGVTPVIISADQVEALHHALGDGSAQSVPAGHATAGPLRN